LKVKDLIAQLSKLDPNLEVFCHDDSPIPIPEGYAGPFEIRDVGAQKVVISRNADHKVTISFDNEAPGARHAALIGITTDI
jgi:hypothetical protein